MNFLREQIDRLDVANRSICFSGISTMNVSKRMIMIDCFMDTNLSDKKIDMIIHHLYKGPYNDRKLIAMSLLEFP